MNNNLGKTLGMLALLLAGIASIPAASADPCPGNSNLVTTAQNCANDAVALAIGTGAYAVQTANGALADAQARVDGAAATARALAAEKSAIVLGAVDGAWASVQPTYNDAQAKAQGAIATVFQVPDLVVALAHYGACRAVGPDPCVSPI